MRYDVSWPDGGPDARGRPNRRGHARRHGPWARARGRGARERARVDLARATRRPAHADGMHASPAAALPACDAPRSEWALDADTMGVRLRQIALVGQDIDWSVDTLRAIFDVHVAFRDPGIVPSFGGMFNALLGFGDTFLEIVSPTDAGYKADSTSAKILRKMGGDCGYMCIFGVDDIAHTSARVAKLGRVATSFGYEIGSELPKPEGKQTSAIVQWHPKDFGTLMETEEQWPPAGSAGLDEGAWLPAGKRWQETYRVRSSSVCEEFAAAVIAVDDPAAMAKKWSMGLECDLLDETTMQLSGADQTVRFETVEANGGRTGVVGVDVYAAPGKPKAFTGEIFVHGIRWRLVDRVGAEGSEQMFDRINPTGVSPRL